MALDTVEEIISQTRVLLQDEIAPYRYADEDLLIALNLGISEASRYRPDFWINSTVPSYSTVDATALVLPTSYRVPFLYFMVGWSQLRDEEDVTDTRASGFLQSFRQILTG